MTPIASGRVLLLVVAAVLLSPAAGVVAQTLPLPPLPEVPVPGQEPPAPGGESPPARGPAPKTPPAKSPSPEAPPGKRPAPVEAVPSSRPQPWEYKLGVGVVEDTNTSFVPDGPSGTAVVPGGLVARTFSSPQGELRAEVAGRWVGYPGQDVTDRTYVDGGLRGEYKSSSHTEWRGDVHYWLGYTDSTPTLVDQGVVLPVGKSGTFSGEASVRHKLATRTLLRVEGRVLSIDFEDPRFTDGRSLRGTLALGRQLGLRDEGSIAYSVERVLAGGVGEASLSHYGSLQWSHTLTNQSAFLLEGGASYTPDAQAAGLSRSEGFFGGATFLRELGRSSLTAYLRREVAPAFGLGMSRLETRAGLRAEVPIGRDWALSLAAYHVQPQAPQGQEKLFASSSDVLAALDRRMGRRFTLSGEVRYRRRGESVSGPTVSGVQAGAYVALENARTRR